MQRLRWSAQWGSTPWVEPSYTAASAGGSAADYVRPYIGRAGWVLLKFCAPETLSSRAVRILPSGVCQGLGPSRYDDYSRSDGLLQRNDPAISVRLMQHMTNCIAGDYLTVFEFQLVSRADSLYAAKCFIPLIFYFS